MKRFLLLTGLLCFASHLHTFASSKREESAQPLPDFARLILGTDSLAVFEGIPRNFPRRKDSEPEKPRPEPTFTVASQTFYEKPIALAEADRATLEGIFHFDSPVQAFRGHKLCGGFHADFLIEWRRKNEPVLRALVCFGCHEIRFVDATDVIETDMTEQGRQRLHTVLDKYRPARPSSAKPAASKPESSTPPKTE
jgi:hypothetical protein